VSGSSTALPERLNATVKSLRISFGTQLAVSIASSSPSIQISFSWSIKIAAGSRYQAMLRAET
jgi:hypothetical protein